MSRVLRRPIRARSASAGLTVLLSVVVSGHAASAHPLETPEEGSAAPKAALAATPSVSDDIAAMGDFGSAARAAGLRLLERGPSTLPEVHAALTDPGESETLRIQLLKLLRDLGDESSVAPVLEVMRAHPEDKQLGATAMRTLAQLPEDPAAIAEAQRILERESEDAQLRGTALGVLASHPRPDWRRWVNRYHNASDPHVRGAALYLSASLSEQDAGDEIRDYLQAEHPKGMRQPMLHALAMVSTPEQLRERTPAALRSTREYRSALMRAELREKSVPAERAEICTELLRSNFGDDQRTGVRCLIELERFDLLESLGGDEAPATLRAPVRNELRREGYELRGKGDAARVERVNGSGP